MPVAADQIFQALAFQERGRSRQDETDGSEPHDEQPSSCLEADQIALWQRWHSKSRLARIGKSVETAETTTAGSL